MNPLGRAVAKIREINRRYSKPRIKLSKWTKMTLLLLRLYLLTLVILLGYRFFTLLRI
jgi:hypothetical protein